MPIQVNSLLSSSVANATFLDKTIDDIKKGKLTLYKINIGDADTVDDVQQFIIDLADTTGIVEGDSQAKIYANTNYIADGDSQKTAIEKTDAQIRVNRLDINSNDVDIAAHEVRLTDNEAAIALNITNIGTNDDDILAIQNSVGAASGIAPLNASTKIDSLYLPSYVDDVEEYANLAAFPVTGEAGKIYVALDTNKTYRWSGSVYTEISPSDVNSVNGYTGIVNLDNTDIGLTNVTDDAQLKREAADFDSFDEKVTPVELDIVLIEDSEDSFNKKKVLLANMLGGSGGSGGSFVWELNEDVSPIESSESGIALLDFDYESEMAISSLLVVPETYIDGKIIVLENMAFVSSSASNNVLFTAVTTLIKTGDDLTALANTHTSTNSEISLSIPNQIERIGVIDLTDTNGYINGIYPQVGDILKIKLYRNNASETVSSVDDARVLKYSATLNFDYELPPGGTPLPALTWETFGSVDVTGSSVTTSEGTFSYTKQAKSLEQSTGGDVSFEGTITSGGIISSIFALQSKPLATVGGGEPQILNSVDVGVTINGGFTKIYEDGVEVYTVAPKVIAGDIVKVSIEGSTYKVYVNSIDTGYTSSRTPTYPVSASVSPYYDGSGANNLIYTII